MLEIRTPTGSLYQRVFHEDMPMEGITFAGGWTVKLVPPMFPVVIAPSEPSYSHDRLRCAGCGAWYEITQGASVVHTSHGGDSELTHEQLLESLTNMQRDRDTWAQRANFASSALAEAGEEAAYVRGANATRERIRQILGLDST